MSCEGVIQMKVFLSIVVAIGFAVVAGTALADRDVTRFSSDDQVVVLLSGCDGLIAPGGVPLTAPDPWPPYTHNFIASIHREGWMKDGPDSSHNSWLTHSRLTGSGTDAAGHAFTIEGTLTYDSDLDPALEKWATGGKVVVRRDDGAFARGDAGGSAPIRNSPPLGTSLASLGVAADQCHL